MDRRLTPANGRVAALHLKGAITADRYSDGAQQSVTLPVLDLCRDPKGARARQLLLGAAVTTYETREGWSFIQSNADGYVGYVPADALAEPAAVTHHVATPATHAYAAEDFKSTDLLAIPFGARVVVLDERRKFWETAHGFVPKSHLWPLEKRFTDPATVAQMHFGVPYLWGGNSTRGIDCSGLVQAALQACGCACPGDSDMQCGTLGKALSPETSLMRGDLLFWAGHVGMMVDQETLIHANAHHMAVAYEPVDRAILRISAQGDGDVLARKRLD